MSVSETIKKIVMVALVVNMFAGCAPLHPSGCHKTTATGSCSSGRWDDQDEWGAQARAIRAAINDKLDEPQNWKGKKCRLHIEFAQDGTPLNISTSNGNKAFCEAIKSAAQKAKFPAFNNPEVYRDFQKSGFDMRG
ncbi:protein TolA [Enterobacter kobei]|nr:protein TolA [Enterobacter kobei]